MKPYPPPSLTLVTPSSPTPTPTLAPRYTHSSAVDSFLWCHSMSFNRCPVLWEGCVAWLCFSKFAFNIWATKPTLKLVQTAKTQISLRIRAVWSESSLIACAFYSLHAIQRWMNENPCHTGWMYRLIWVFAGHTGLIVGFVMRWLISKLSCIQMKLTQCWLIRVHVTSRTLDWLQSPVTKYFFSYNPVW